MLKFVSYRFCSFIISLILTKVVFFIEKIHRIEYTKDIEYISYLECSTTPIVLILHLTKGTPIFISGCHASFVSGRQKLMCGNPPGYG